MENEYFARTQCRLSFEFAFLSCVLCRPYSLLPHHLRYSHHPPVKLGPTTIPNSTSVTLIAGSETPVLTRTRTQQHRPPPSSADYAIAPTAHPFMSMYDTQEVGRLWLRRKLRLDVCPSCFAHRSVCYGGSPKENWHR